MGFAQPCIFEPSPIFRGRAPHGILNWLVFRDEAWKVIDLKPKYVSNYGQSLLQSAIAGHGIALLPSLGVADDVRAGRLQVLALEDRPISVSGDTKTGMNLLCYPPKFRLQKNQGQVNFLVAELRRNSSRT